MIWSVVHFVITLGHFEAFVMPLRSHETSDQYPLKRTKLQKPHTSDYLEVLFNSAEQNFEEMILNCMFNSTVFFGLFCVLLFLQDVLLKKNVCPRIF